MKSVLIPDKLHERLKRACLDRKIQINLATIEAIDSWITYKRLSRLLRIRR